MNGADTSKENGCRKVKKMEVDSGNIEKKAENFDRNLRKRKKDLIVKKIVKHRTRKIKVIPSRKSMRRHKSLEPLEKHNSAKDTHISLSSTSTTSLDSVIYLGYYRKIPQLITLEENSDSVKTQNETVQEPVVIENKTVKTSPYTIEETTSGGIINDSSTDIRDTNYLLGLLNDMCVGPTNKRTTRTRTRRGKN